ncbi:hypothetical protein HDV00_010410 [Rhizophlyctis rosea]|nr:hypothetical protein HDV00_010410 [Rhizophlyctis rosea]
MHLQQKSIQLRALLLQTVAAVAVSATPTQLGSWEMKTENSGVVAVHMALLPSSRLLLTERFHEPPNDSPDLRNQLVATGFYSSNKNLDSFLTDSSEFDLNTNSYRMINYIPENEVQGQNEGYAFCAGAAQMADGSVIVAGGDQKWYLEFKGRNYTTDGRRDVRIYRDGKFNKVASMPTQFIDGTESKLYSGRWYPSAMILPNENVIIIGGHHLYYTPNDPLANNPTYDIFNPSTNTLSPTVRVPMLVTTYPINMYPIIHVLPKTGRIWALAGHDTVTIDVKDGSQLNGTQLPKNDGIMGRSFPFAPSHWMNPLSPANGYTATAWICGGTNSTGPDGQPVRREGGQTQWWANCPQCLATARCYHLELETEGATWVAEDMPLARSQSTAVNLPDGTIAIVGGSGRGHQGGNAGTPYGFEPVNQVVIFNPRKKLGHPKRWTVGAAAKVARQYHHTALLLTDGTILTGGDDEQNFVDRVGVDPYSLKLEVYKPPYIFFDNRPSFDLGKIPQHLSYDHPFVVTFTSDIAPRIKSVSLIRFSTVTHSTNFDQRQIMLEALKYSNNRMLVKSPPNANIAPPGNYMLWAVDDRGAVVIKAAEINLREKHPKESFQWNDAENRAPEWKVNDEELPDWKSGTANAAGRSWDIGVNGAAVGLVGLVLLFWG